MSKKLSLTFACGDYEIVRPLMDGRVKPDGIDLVVLGLASIAAAMLVGNWPLAVLQTRFRQE